jgi:hypothetical protein
LLVVNAINGKTRDQIEFGVIINYCRFLLANNPNFEISFIRRQTNFVAHTLVMATMR